MKIHVDESASGSIVVVSGRFDVHEVSAFRAVVEPLTTGATGDVRVDLHGAVFIDSAGLAELVRAMRQCREHGADLVLERPSEPVTIILELTRLDLAFTIGSAAA